jgi:hypothetical protein
MTVQSALWPFVRFTLCAALAGGSTLIPMAARAAAPPVVPTVTAKPATLASPLAKSTLPRTATPAAAESLQPAVPTWARVLAQKVPNAGARQSWAMDVPGDPHTAGATLAGFETFMTNQQAVVAKHLPQWVALASRLMPSPGVQLKAQATPAQARQLFGEFAKSNIGTEIPDDYCYARADVAAVAGQRPVLAPDPNRAWLTPRPGFQMKKVTATGVLTVKTPNAEVPITWGYHVAPAVDVVQSDGTVKTMVIDPSLAKGPVTIDAWKALMNGRNATIAITGPDQLTSAMPVMTGQARVTALAWNLAAVEAVRRGYEPLRADALVRDGK